MSRRLPGAGSQRSALLPAIPIYDLHVWENGVCQRLRADAGHDNRATNIEIGTGIGGGDADDLTYAAVEQLCISELDPTAR